MAKIVLQDIEGGYNLSKINDNFDKIETTFNDKVLYRDNPTGETNTLLSDIDVNHKVLYNLPFPVLDSQAVPYSLVKNMIIGSVGGIIWRGEWATNTIYDVNNAVSYNGSSYICISVHTSGIFATDLANNKLSVLAQAGTDGADGGVPNASGITFAPTAPLTSTTVQTAILEAYSRAVSDAPGTGGSGVALPFLNVKAAPYSAIGNGVANDTTAISTADVVAAKKYVPLGTYLTTLASTSLSGPFFGEGRVKDSGGNLRSPNFSHVMAAPSSIGGVSSVETAFNGDLSKCQFPVEHRITGAATLGQPTTGYTYTPEAFPHYTRLHNTSGWNNGTADPTGRTGAAAHYTVVEQYGQGDAMCYIGQAYVGSTRPGGTDVFCNPAGVLFAGDVTSGINGAYLNPVEINCIDGGFDCVAVGAVFNMWRTNSTGAKRAFWNGVRVQSLGTQPINAGYSLNGLADSGLDFTSATITNTSSIKPAIMLKAGDCIMGNAVQGSGYGDFTAGTALLTYSTASAGWVMQVAGNPTLQVSATQALVVGQFFVNPAGTLRLQVTDATTVVSNSFSHTGSTCGFFGATPQVQYTGWGTPTGQGSILNFPGGSATLAQCGGALSCVITYLKANGMFAA